MVARTQPEVVQPVTITVSRCIAVSSEISGVPWKNDGHFFGRSTSRVVPEPPVDLRPSASRA